MRDGLADVINAERRQTWSAPSVPSVFVCHRRFVSERQRRKQNHEELRRHDVQNCWDSVPDSAGTDGVEPRNKTCCLCESPASKLEPHATREKNRLNESNVRDKGSAYTEGNRKEQNKLKTCRLKRETLAREELVRPLLVGQK